MQMQPLASHLNERITIEKPVYYSDSCGGHNVEWRVYATLWALIKPLNKGGEFVDYGKLNLKKAYRVTVRYSVFIDETMRVVWRGNVLDIVQVDVYRREGVVVLRALSS